MSEKRMISNNIIGSDKFWLMTGNAQALYFQILSRADDEGFCGEWKIIVNSKRGYQKYMKTLEDNGFICIFPSGVCVVMHFHAMNTIRKDRYRPTYYRMERELLAVDDYGEYYLLPEAREWLNEQKTPAAATEKRIFKPAEKPVERPTEYAPVERPYIPEEKPVAEEKKPVAAEEKPVKREAPPTLREMREKREQERAQVTEITADDEAILEELRANLRAVSESGLPDLKDVKKYAETEGLKYLNCEKFFEYYDSRDWKKSNGTLIKDWRAEARKWDAGDKIWLNNKVQTRKTDFHGREEPYGDWIYTKPEDLVV